MGRGLDGYYYLLIGLVRFSSSTGAVSQNFRWRIASGRHLFPFRTEQLSHSAPMVLGGQPPGRVGRRRFFLAVRARVWRGLRTSISGALSHDRVARVALLRHATRSRHIACFSSPSLPRQTLARTADSRSKESGFLQEVALRGSDLSSGRGARGRRTVCATLASAPSGLEPVLAEGCEVDQEVGGVGQPAGEFLL